MRLAPSLLPLLLATTVYATPAFAKDFTDWEAACDNTRNCQAVGMSSSDGDASGYLTLQRGGNAGDTATLSFWGDAQDEDAGLAGKSFAITVDDKPMPGLEREFSFTSDKDSTLGEARLTPEETATLL